MGTATCGIAGGRKSGYDIAGDEGFDGHGDKASGYRVTCRVLIAGDEGFDGHGDAARLGGTGPGKTSLGMKDSMGTATAHVAAIGRHGQIAGDEGFDGHGDDLSKFGNIAKSGHRWG